MSEQTNPKSRRQFLRNTALTSLSLGMIPEMLRSEPVQKNNISLVCIPTTLDYYGQGPFYTSNPPELINNQLATLNEAGTRLILSGRVQNLDCSVVIPDTIIDAWHANNAGAYDNSGYNLRGYTKSNAQGFFIIETILPGKYLNGSSYRPSHIHFKITPPGFPTIITQLYFEGDTFIPGDAAASITSGTFDASARIIPIIMNPQGAYEGTWDITVDGVNGTGKTEIHLDKGVIYSVSPNPFSSELIINYGVFQKSKVNIEVFDMKGSLIGVLDQRELEPEKYSAHWKPDTTLPSGIYWVALKQNDLQVHYLKVVKN